MSSRLISWSTLVFYIALFPPLACASSYASWFQGGSPAQAAPHDDPDALYRDRSDPGRAQQAADIWARLEANPRDFESAWKLARAQYWLGTQGPSDKRRDALQQGTDAGRRASMIEASRPEGFFWMAANMGTLAELYGLRQGIKYRGAIKDALETVLRIDPAFQNGSADRALGRWYFKVPGLFGGSKKKSEEHLRKSLTYAPNSTASHYFLAETLFDMNRDTEAREELQKVIAAPILTGCRRSRPNRRRSNSSRQGRPCRPRLYRYNRSLRSFNPALTALRHRNFRLIWVGLLLSFTGSFMQNAALLWHVSLLVEPEQKGLALGAVGLVRVVPIIVFSMISGVVADAWDRRRLMLMTQTGSAIVAIGLALLAFSSYTSVWPVYALAALSRPWRVRLPARQSLVPSLVPREDLPNAISLNTIMQQTAQVWACDRRDRHCLDKRGLGTSSMPFPSSP
jgi:tetratricopeptide (TPR) repeat protein